MLSAAEDCRKVLHFWFEGLSPEQWWTKDTALDRTITQTFSSVHAQAQRGELSHWRQHPQGRLAEIIVLDQFSRNIYRYQAAAFACDTLALMLAQEAIAVGADQALNATQRSFVYLPFMHSESPLIHEEAIRLFNQPGLEHNLDFEKRHKAIIDRFGRYPHRNTVLGRVSTPEEIEFLKTPGSSF